MKQALRRWLNETPDYKEGLNVMWKSNDIYVETIRILIQEGRKVEFPVRGRSMRIFVEHERDKALLEPCDSSMLKRGDVVLAKVEGGNYVLHRIIRTEGQLLTLMGDGNLRGTESCSRQDAIAIVTAFYRKGRTTPDRLDTRKWRLYSFIWMHTVPIRRWLLLAWKLKNRLISK